ncbi:glycosyltransferase [Rubrobacter tropicus]|uniref:Glycosyltransferase n=1 Tax=Rubrobacter tropicus TaxID=2653851 RepID=A0A6G8Q7N0_9ACTN|nr:glycosyltransferase family 4 protein [Rubrobacter tropicus]QIN82494.1 glycosyltransferase [Rubrobacter tropicus]
MKVAYVVKRYPRYSETFVVNEILAHEAAGVEVGIFSLLPPEDGHFQDAISRVRAPVTYLQAKGLKASDLWATLDEAGEDLPNLWGALEEARGGDVRQVYQAVLLAREARRGGFSHLHAHFATASTTVARLAARFAGLPYSLTAHAKDIFHESVDPEDLRRKLSDAAASVTVSDFNLKYLRERYGRAADGTRRIYNGLELERFPYGDPRHREPGIVAVGRLVEKKGFADLVEACALLRDRGVRFRARIVGLGDQEEHLRSLIKSRGLRDLVDLAGPLPQREMARVVGGASVFAAPCVVGGDGNRDGLPTVLLEAMALGTPCVSTDVTGIPEVLRHGETGLMVPQRDPAALAGALERLLGDAALRVRLARGARRLIEAEFDVSRNAAILREVFASGGGLEEPSAREATLA